MRKAANRTSSWREPTVFPAACLTSLSSPALLRFELPGREAPLRVRHSTRARRVSLSIDAASGMVELVVPEGVALARAMAFLEGKRAWVAARLAALPGRVGFEDGAEIPLLGSPHRIRHRGPGRGAVSVRDGEIHVFGQTEHVPRRVRDHLAAMARQVLTTRARRLAERVGRKIVRVTVRDTRSRWGSCTHDGKLSFCWRLILAPEPVLDYVVAHEVAHLLHMNHGPRFWRVVEQLSPEWRRHRAWLAYHRAELLRYG
jgi:predicted metal-dependent hydrolase